jgi:hypothetical protein
MGTTTTMATLDRAPGDARRAERAALASLEGMSRAELRALGLRRCTGCDRIKPIGVAFDLQRKPGGKTYPRSRCKACARIARATGGQSDSPARRARRTAYQRAYRREHPEKTTAYYHSPLGRLRNQLSTARYQAKTRAKTADSRAGYARRIAAIEAEIRRLAGEGG